MEFLLDGGDWEADYFISSKADELQTRDSGRIDHMGMRGALSANFIGLPGRGAPAPARYRNVRVPGCDRTVLADAGEIGDIMYGRNLERSSWAEKQSWAFRKTFTLPEELRHARRLRLEFLALDYECSVWLNGARLEFHCNAFIPAEFDITRQVRRDGENVLAVIFEPIPQASPLHYHDKPAEFAYHHRMAMSFGWDWSRPLLASGILDSVRILGSDAGYIRDLHFQGAGDTATLELTLDAEEDMTAPVEVTLTPANFTGEGAAYREEFVLEQGRNVRTMTLKLKDAHQWYPNGYGKPDLYDLAVSFAGDTRELPVGFRTLAMHRNPGSSADALPLTFVVNGEAVFVRGLNWVPADLRLSEVRDAEYERLVRLAAEAGFNFLRIWGGGTVEKEAFYRCCDRYGMLVQQEFMHACSEAPSDNKYLAECRREGIAILRKIRNHVSIARLCGGNEHQYYGEDPDSSLTVQYGELSAHYMPGIPYLRSCPDRLHPGESPHGPWHFRPHAFYNTHFRHFASEIGCTGTPELESVRRFIPDDAAFPDCQDTRYHFLFFDPYRGLQNQWKFFAPQNRSEYCQSSMLTQGDVLSYIMAHYRREFPASSGCVFWQFNESWPTFTYSIVDYYRLPKAAYYRTARVNAPAIMGLEDGSWCIENGRYCGKAFVTLDRPGRYAGRILAVSAAGRTAFERKFEQEFAAGTTAVAEVDFPVTEQDKVVFIRLELCDEAGKQVFCDTRHYGVPDFKELFHLPPAEVVLSGAVRGENAVQLTLRNPGATVAAGVRLRLPEIPDDTVYWLDNYLELLPGEERTIAVKFAGSVPENAALEISGWNVAAGAGK